MAGKKNNIEWDYLTDFTWERVLSSGVTEVLQDVPDANVIDISGSRRGNSNIIFVSLPLLINEATRTFDTSSSSDFSGPTITTLNVELWGCFGYNATVPEGVTNGEYWVKVAEDLNEDIIRGKLIRFEGLPCGKYKVVVSGFVCDGEQIGVLTAYTQ
jgi:hypothetical protein